MGRMKAMGCYAGASLLGVALVMFASPAPALTPAQVFKAASASVVTVHVYDNQFKEIAQGSGVVIGPGHVVTNCHLFKGRAASLQIGQGSARLPGYLFQGDVSRDLCAVRAQDLTAPAASQGSSDSVEIGDPLYAIGAPQGFELTLSDGLLSGRRGTDDDYLLQTTAPISPGSSGGGLFDSNAQLIGITTLFYKDSQQINFAVPVEWLRDLAKTPVVSDEDSYLRAKNDQAMVRALESMNMAVTKSGSNRENTSARDAEDRSALHRKTDTKPTVYRYRLGGARHYGTTVPPGATEVARVTPGN